MRFTRWVRSTMCTTTMLVAGMAVHGEALATPTLDTVVDAALRKVDATPSQRAAVRKIAWQALDELDADHRASAVELGNRAYDALTAPRVDRAALEATRKDAVGWLDSASAELLPHIADAADVLDPRQRSALAQALIDEAGKWLPAPNGA